MLLDLEHVEAAAITGMGVVCLAVAITSLRRPLVLDRATASLLLVAGLAALLWKASLFFGYSEDDVPLVELQETVFFLSLAATLFLWASGQLGRHARLLQASNEQLRAANAMRAELVQTISHDLAGPLTPMKVQVHLLGKRLPEGEGRGPLEIVKRNLDQMERLVGDLRDVALIDAGRLRIDPRPTDLAVLLDHAARTAGPTLEASGIRFETRWPQPLAIVADPQRIGQVLDNLLSNARKFTPGGGLIVLEASAQDGRARVAVRDSGRGLEPAERARLFRPFSQVHAAGESRERGTGLGLYICRNLAEQHGGRVWAESAGRGHGSTFLFELPLATAVPST